MIHKLKILPVYFKAVDRGDKRFEIRDNSDRAFQKGDTVILREFEHINGYTGAEITVEITYVTNYNQPDNQVVFGFFVIDGKEIDLDISGQLDKLLAKQKLAIQGEDSQFKGGESSRSVMARIDSDCWVNGDKAKWRNDSGCVFVGLCSDDNFCVVERNEDIEMVFVSELSKPLAPEQIRIKNGQALRELFESLQYEDTDTENVWANFADLVTLKSEHEE